MVNGEWAMVNGQNAKFFLYQKFTIQNSQIKIHHCQFTIAHSPLSIHHSPFTIQNSQIKIHHCQFTIAHSPFTTPYPSALKISLKIFPADNSSMSLS
jgi:hypothetical protein